jgi:two-component system, NarL family, invasion response regulator UvrY
MKILICEDHRLVRKNMIKLFEETPGICFISEAKNGKQALEILGKTPVDVVLLDLILPDMHGFEVLDKIVQQWPDVKVLVLTADAYEESAVKSFQKGAWGYLNKDVDPDILIEAMHSVYEGKKYILPVVVDLLSLPQNIEGYKELYKKLSAREYEVMIKLAEEKSYREISNELFISVNAVGSHRTNIMKILGLKKNTELTKYCIKNKLI